MNTIKTIAAVAGLLVGLAPYDAKAAPPMTGDDWAKYCMGEHPPGRPKTQAERGIYYVEGRAICKAYVLGLADGLGLWGGTVGDKDAPTCIPPKTSADQLKDVGLEFWMKNPKERHVRASLFLGTAFQEAWPCKEAR
jgi:Rap1a immunity proteins